MKNYIAKWLRAGLSTEPADRPRAEQGVRLVYAEAGLAVPKTVIWLDSPAAGVLGAAWLAATESAGPFVFREVWAQVGAEVDVELRSRIPTSVWQTAMEQCATEVGTQVWDQVGNVLCEQLRANINQSIASAAADQVWDRIREKVEWREGDPVVDASSWALLAAYGQHHAGLRAFYDYFATAGGARLNGLAEIAQSSGWWWPFANAVILTERPVQLHRDTDRQLHCEDRPALLYRDGSGVWAEHGRDLNYAPILHRPDPQMNIADALPALTIYDQRRCRSQRMKGRVG